MVSNNNFMKCLIKFIILLILIKIVQFHFKIEDASYVKKVMKLMKVYNVYKYLIVIVNKVITICLHYI